MKYNFLGKLFYVPIYKRIQGSLVYIRPKVFLEGGKAFFYSTLSIFMVPEPVQRTFKQS